MSIEKSKQLRYWELSLIGQFRALDRDNARLFAQAVADAAQETGLNDCGYDVREMSASIVSDEAARMQLLNDTWRPEWGPKPWVQQAVEILAEPFPTDPTHEEVTKRLEVSRKALEAGDGEQGTDS